MDSTVALKFLSCLPATQRFTSPRFSSSLIVSLLSRRTTLGRTRDPPHRACLRSSCRLNSLALHRCATLPYIDSFIDQARGPGLGWPGLACKATAPLAAKVSRFAKIKCTLPRLAWPGLASPGLAWPRLAWCGLASRRLAWSRLAWPGLASPGLAWPRLAWSGLASPRLAWSRLAWPGLASPRMA